MHLSPPKKKHTRNKNKKRLCLSIHPSIHLSIHQSIGGPITPFISYPYIYWILSQNGMGPMTKTSDVAPKKRWCESFNLAYHLGKPPWCWSGCYFGTDGRWSFFFLEKVGKRLRFNETGLFLVGWVLLLNGDGGFFGETTSTPKKDQTLHFGSSRCLFSRVLGLWGWVLDGFWYFISSKTAYGLSLESFVCWDLCTL